ncbi:MAG: type I secretion C-terminal target domain-containing protein, partial [Endozoicomonas sp.]
AGSFVLEVDMKKNTWGSVFGIGSDLDGSGQITAKGSNNEQGLKFSFGGVNNNFLQVALADGSTVNTSVGSDTSWFRFRWEIDTEANNGQGKGTLMFKNLSGGNSDWTVLPELTDLNLGLAPGATDASNPANWDGFFLHFEGAGSGLSNLVVESSRLEGTASGEIINGTAESETILGQAGDDVIFGGAGNDTLTGGEGSDRFAWSSDDLGTVQEPAEDVIKDFQLGEDGDVIDLSDVLIDESETLDQYLSLNFEGGDTTLEVKPSADGSVTQKIKLEGVDLSSLGSSDSEIINNLLNDGNLQLD